MKLLNDNWEFAIAVGIGLAAFLALNLLYG